MLQTNPNELNRVSHTYYQVGDFKTVSKTLALEKANGDISKVQFCWMDKIWDNTNMTQEPVASWAELCRMRAQQLRDRYTHLALMYSGGWDSHTALMSFIRNNIHLDEIIVWDRSSHVVDPEMPVAYESAKQIIKDHGLQTKLTVFEIPWDFHAEIYKEFGEDWIYLPGCHYCFNKTMRVLQHQRQKELLDVKRPYSRVSSCYIEAHDRPRVSFHDNKWYTFYVDTALSAYWATESGGPEMFYFTPDFPELHLKQVYMSMKYFEYKLNSDPTFTSQTIHEIQSYTRPDLFAEYNMAIGRTSMADQSARLGLSKHNTLHTPKKLEMMKLLTHTKNYIEDVYRIYENGLKKISEISGYDAVDGEVPSICSKFYFLRNFHSMRSA